MRVTNYESTAAVRINLLSSLFFDVKYLILFAATVFDKNPSKMVYLALKSIKSIKSKTKIYTYGGKMSSPKESLQAIKDKSKQELEKIGFFKPVKIYVGSATCENAAGAQEVMEIFENALKDGSADFYLTKKGCAGRCNLEPTVEVVTEKEIVKYVQVNAQKAQEIIKKYLNAGASK
ncbi:MAG: (2Fe-2S) ferredoxin domain-containing protein [Endomicrobia bacterium]|nr:(2Fe-2S) ferredoxin domain-containing protein [Endomicrobiia bacterium]